MDERPILVPCCHDHDQRQQQQQHDDVMLVRASPVVVQATLTNQQIPATIPTPPVATSTAHQWLQPGAGVIAGASQYSCALDKEVFEQGPQRALISSGAWRLPSFAEIYCDAALLVGRNIFVAGFGKGVITAKITRCITSNTNAVTFEGEGV
jgi:hypothetical protein